MRAVGKDVSSDTASEAAPGPGSGQGWNCSSSGGTASEWPRGVSRCTLLND